MKFSNINFIEIAVNNLEKIRNDFLKFGFHIKAIHRWKKILVMRHNSLYVVLNCMATSHAIKSHIESGDSICGIGVSGQNSIEKMSVFSLIYKQLYNALEVMPFIGNCQFYLLDKNRDFFDNGEWILNKKIQKKTAYVTGLDRITFAVNQSNIEYWVKYIEEKLIDLRSSLDLDLEGQHKGVSFVSSSGKVKISIVATKDENTQIQEFFSVLRNEGVRQIAFEKSNLLLRIEDAKENKVFSFERVLAPCDTQVF